MNHITSIGLDVHARSITAAAFNPLTGEITTKRFGNSPAEVAEWILVFESPKAVYESGVTGFYLVRELRALGVDCIVGAVSKMQKPCADKRKKNDRTDAEFLAQLPLCKTSSKCLCLMKSAKLCVTSHAYWRMSGRTSSEQNSA